jgi:hypothetical protein
VSRQFTDGEIAAAIRALAAEGSPLTRASVRKRLGGGGSTRISAILKEYNAGAHGALPRSGPEKVRTDESGPIRSGPTGSGPAMGSSADGVAKAADSVSAASSASSPTVDGPEGCVAQLQSEIRVLKILLESERNARREDEARHGRTIEALQREIEIASRGWSERGVVQVTGPPRPRSKARS